MVFFVLLAGEVHYFGRNTWLWFTLVEFIAIAWQTIVLTMWMKQPAPSRVCPAPAPNEGPIERFWRMSNAATLTLLRGPPVPTPDTTAVRIPATLMSASCESDDDTDNNSSDDDSDLEEATPTTSSLSLEARHVGQASSSGKLMLPPITHPNKLTT